MTTIQRMKSDLTTMDRREMVDRAMVNSRDRNDALTQERRFEADATLKKNRAKNDEITAERREVKDECLIVATWVEKEGQYLIGPCTSFITKYPYYYDKTKK